MAIANTTVWEVRPTAGSDTNGGGYVPGSSGTDWTQQNAAKYSLTNGTTNGTTTIATVSAVADMVGNIAYVAGGTGSITAAWYQIVSQITGVSITVDRSTGLTAGTGVTINIGGAMATVSAAVAAAVVDNTFYFKATGTYTETATLALTFGNDTVMQFIGYSSTRGDGGQVTWTTATNSTVLIQFQSSYLFSFQNFIFTNTAVTPAVGFNNNNTIIYSVQFRNCVFSGFTNAINGNFASIDQFINLELDSCEVKNCTSQGIVNSGNTTMFGCYVHGNTSHGMYLTSGGLVHNGSVLAVRSVFYNNGGSGVYLDSGANQIAQFFNCVCASNTNDGVQNG